MASSSENVDKNDWLQYVKETSSRNSEKQSRRNLSTEHQTFAGHAGPGGENSDLNSGSTPLENSIHVDNSSLLVHNEAPRSEYSKSFTAEEIPKESSQNSSIPSRTSEQENTGPRLLGLNQALNQVKIQEEAQPRPKAADRDSGIGSRLQRQDELNNSLGRIDFDEESFEDEGYIEEQINFHLEKALECWVKGRYEEQEGHLNVLIDDLSGPHLLRAKIDKSCSLLKRRLSKAAFDLLQDFKYDPSSEPSLNMAAYYCRAAAAYKMGQSDSALRDCKRGIALYNKLPAEGGKNNQKTIRIRVAFTKLASQICSGLGRHADSSFYESLTKKAEKDVTDVKIELWEFYPKFFIDFDEVDEQYINRASAEDGFQVYYELEATEGQAAELDAMGSEVRINTQTVDDDTSTSQQDEKDSSFPSPFVSFGFRDQLLLFNGQGGNVNLTMDSNTVHSSEEDAVVLHGENGKLEEMGWYILKRANEIKLLYYRQADGQNALEHFQFEFLSLFALLLTNPSISDKYVLETICSMKDPDIHKIWDVDFPNLPPILPLHPLMRNPIPRTLVQYIVRIAGSFKPISLNKEKKSDIIRPLFELLVENGSMLNEFDRDGNHTAASIAVLTGQTLMVNDIISRGAFFKDEYFYGGSRSISATYCTPMRCAIFRAARCGDMDILKQLVKEGGTLVYTDKYGCSNLHWAVMVCSSVYTEIIDYMIEAWPPEKLGDKYIYPKLGLPRPLSAVQLAKELGYQYVTMRFSANFIYDY